jgi:hypothetical protein
MTRVALFAAVAAVAAVVSSAHASPIVLSSGSLGPGFSKDNPISSSNAHSALGAAASLSIDVAITDTSHATITAHLGNIGAGVLTDFGIDLNNAFGWTFSSFSTANAVSVDGVHYVNGASGVSGLIAHVDVGAGPTSPGTTNGLEHGESIDLIWSETGSFGSITASTAFSSLITPTLVTDADGGTFDSFWVAHVQSLAGGASDKIGGADPTTAVPEPMTLALFSSSLIALGAWRRRVRAQAAHTGT